MHAPSNPTFPGVKVEVSGSHFQQKPSIAHALMGLINPQQLWFVFYS